MSEMTADDVRRIVREEIERARPLPVYTTPQPIPPGHGWPSLPNLLSPCPHGCAPLTVCMSVSCPKRLTIT